MTTPISERRSHIRVEMPCPVSLTCPGGKDLPDARVENVSDGGLFAVAPIEALPQFGSELDVKLRLPRSTPNSFMYEEVRCKATVTRHQPLVGGNQTAGIALRFTKPMDLMLEA